MGSGLMDEIDFCFVFFPGLSWISYFVSSTRVFVILLFFGALAVGKPNLFCHSFNLSEVCFVFIW